MVAFQCCTLLSYTNRQLIFQILIDLQQLKYSPKAVVIFPP